MPPILFGTFQEPEPNQNTMNRIIKCALENGCRGFDTSPSYNTETKLGFSLNNLIKAGLLSRDKVYISDKIDGMQIYESDGNIYKYVINSIRKINCSYLDLCLIHWPFLDYIENVWHNLLRLKNDGKIRNIGICNVTRRKLEEIHDRIKMFPDVIQNEISPLNYDYDVEFFQNNNIIVQAYSPLCRLEFRRVLFRSKSDVLNELASKYNRNIAQIILNWHRQRGIVPVFSSKKEERIISNLNESDFVFTKDEMEKIKSLDEGYKIFPYSFACPGY